MANPMYRQIAEDLRAQIESGELRPGQQLPTELELQDHHGASRNTVRDAIKWLTTLGLVESRPGQGTFVVEKIDPFVTTLSGDPGRGVLEGATYLSEVSEQNRKPSTSAIQVEIQQATEAVAISLRIPHDTEVISRHERRFIDDTPWSMQTSYYPVEFADRGASRLRSARDIPEGTVKYLAATLHLVQVGYRDWITVRAPNAIEADFFSLPGDGRIPMYEIFRTAFDGNGQPMRLTVTVYPADRNQFMVDVGNVPEPLSNKNASTAGDLQDLQFHKRAFQEIGPAFQVLRPGSSNNGPDRLRPQIYNIVMTAGTGHSGLGAWKNLRAELLYVLLTRCVPIGAIPGREKVPWQSFMHGLPSSTGTSTMTPASN